MSRRLVRGLTVTALAGTLAVGGTAVAFAAGSSPAPGPSASATPTHAKSTDHVAAACATIGTRKGKLDDRAARLKGGDTTKGSIDHLKARAVKATAHGRDNAAEALTMRVELREQRVTQIGARLDELAKVESAHC